MDPNNTNDDSSLVVFIERNHERILGQWEKFARSIPSASRLDRRVLRDHAVGILRTIAADLKIAQTPLEQSEKSKGRAPSNEQDTQAELHAVDRVAIGFTINDTISEFRALRASVLQLWGAAKPGENSFLTEELIRFNEAIDQALAESIMRFTRQKDETTRRFDMLLSSSPDLCFISGVDGTLIYINGPLRDHLAKSAEEIVGMTLNTLWPALATGILSELNKVNETRASIRGEVKLAALDGESHSYRYVLLPVLNSAGEVDSIAATVRNISELAEAEAKVYRSAYYDGVTQLPNRALLYDRLEHDLRHAQRTGTLLALLFIDLDHFKEVNDRAGHAVGDQLLQAAAQRISACVRRDDTVARIGGDEFTVTLSDMHTVVHVEIIAQSILDQLSRPVNIAGTDYLVSGSIGIAVYPKDGTAPDQLLSNADHAMYVSKEAGGNRFSFFTAEMRESAWARLKTIDELRQALPLHQLEVYYQPIVDLATGAILKSEALVRWHHPSGTTMMPCAFIELAEQTGLIRTIDSWVLREAVVYARDCTMLLGQPFQISVNKSPVELMSAAMPGSWEGDLALLKTASGAIAFEITEGVLLKDSEAVRERLATLKRTGVQFTIDDFGIGYSSLSYLKKFHVDFLKIDQSFIKDMLSTVEDSVFAETIIVMSHKLGLKVIAEGVETVEQREWLRAMGCDYGQGFLFSPAVPSGRLTELLASWQGRFNNINNLSN